MKIDFLPGTNALTIAGTAANCHKAVPTSASALIYRRRQPKFDQGRLAFYADDSIGTHANASPRPHSCADNFTLFAGAEAH
jgi:hypothetical protein